MIAMRFAVIMVAYVLLAPSTASAQLIPPGGSQFNPPPLHRRRHRGSKCRRFPKMDAPLPLPQVQGSQRGSFGDRISKCLDDAAAAGLRPGERAAYSRSCANQ
jgi:hypothetical protein